MDEQPRKHSGPGDVACLAALAALHVVLYLLTPRSGDFWWSEAPRNALNGAFILDFLRQWPMDDPVGWAYDYYRRYPALTILFYPFLYHVLLAGLYAALGVSHATAALLANFFFAALTAGCYALGRRFLPPLGALAAAVLLAAAPAVQIWGLQVMLDVPMMAVMTWSFVFALRHADHGRNADLYATAALAVAALYIKQQAAFILPAVLAAIVAGRGARFLASGRTWLVALAATAALLPLAVVQLRFGAFNVMSALARPDNQPQGIDSLLFYLRQLPSIVGWATLLLAVAGVVAGCATLRRGAGFRPNGLVLVCWFAGYYGVMTLISLKEQRHGLPLAVPVCLAAAWTCHVLAGWRGPHLALALAAAMLATSPMRGNIPAVQGYQEAARKVAELAPPGGRVMFLGSRDGSFIYNMRVLESRGDISAVRADKVFLDIRVHPEMGLGARNYTAEEVACLLRDYGISLVVAADDFWFDTPVLNNLRRVLEGDGFALVADIPVRANVPHQDTHVAIYRQLGPLPRNPQQYDINLPAAGLTIRGAAGK